MQQKLHLPLSNRVFEEVLDLRGRSCAFSSADLCSSCEQYQSRQRADPELLRQHWQTFGIHFSHNAFTCIPGSHSFYFWHHHFAWATPIGPKIYQDWEAGLGGEGSKAGFLVDFQR